MRSVHLVIFLAAGLPVTAACAPRAEGTAPEGPRLVLPIAWRVGVDCQIQSYVDVQAGPGAQDYRCGSETNEGHGGVDFRLPDMAPQRAGVAVLAAASGRVACFRDGIADISVTSPGAPIIAGQECGSGVVIDHSGGWETQYCHLAQGGVQVRVGQSVRAGEHLARVGLSGQTEFAHRHFETRRDVVRFDPFAPDPYAEACTDQAGLWTKAVKASLGYRRSAVLNAGFAGGPVELAAIEAAGTSAAKLDAPTLVAYARSINLKAGDVQSLAMRGPRGEVLAQSRLVPLDRAMAQTMVFVGRERPEGGFLPGVYTADYWVDREGRTVLRAPWRWSSAAGATAAGSTPTFASQKR